MLKRMMGHGRFWLILAMLLLPATLALGQMRTIQSRHYTIHSDLPPDLTHELTQRMDAMYDEYSRRLTSFRSSGEEQRLEAYLFTRRADYETITGPGMRNTGGVFIPERNCLAAVLEGNGRMGLRHVLQHEAFHQFAHNRISPNLPIWLNEGLAELFEDGLWTGEGFVIGEVPPWRVSLLQENMRQRRLIDFRTFMAWSPIDWNRRLTLDADQVGIQYNQAWAMVHFLVYATEGTGEPYYRPRLINMLGRLHAGQDAQSAFRSSFSSNLDGFQERFVAYARRLESTDASQYLQHMAVLAELLRLGGRDVFGTMDDFRTAARSQWHRVREAGFDNATVDPTVYFSYTNGQPMAANCLYFDRRGGPLPDIVCEPLDHLRIRATFFHNEAGEIEYDLKTEPLR